MKLLLKCYGWFRKNNVDNMFVRQQQVESEFILHMLPKSVKIYENEAEKLKKSPQAALTLGLKGK